MLLLSKLKAYAWAILAFVLAGLGVFGATMKGQRDRARVSAETAEARVHAEKIIKKVKKEKKKELSRKESEIRVRIKKEVKKPEDLDNLFNNDSW